MESVIYCCYNISFCSLTCGIHVGCAVPERLVQMYMFCVTGKRVDGERDLYMLCVTGKRVDGERDLYMLCVTGARVDGERDSYMLCVT